MEIHFIIYFWSYVFKACWFSIGRYFDYDYARRRDSDHFDFRFQIRSDRRQRGPSGQPPPPYQHSPIRLFRPENYVPEFGDIRSNHSLDSDSEDSRYDLVHNPRSRRSGSPQFEEVQHIAPPPAPPAPPAPQRDPSIEYLGTFQRPAHRIRDPRLRRLAPIHTPPFPSRVLEEQRIREESVSVDPNDLPNVPETIVVIDTRSQISPILYPFYPRRTVPLVRSIGPSHPVVIVDDNAENEWYSAEGSPENLAAEVTVERRERILRWIDNEEDRHNSSGYIDQ